MASGFSGMQICNVVHILGYIMIYGWGQGLIIGDNGGTMVCGLGWQW